MLSDGEPQAVTTAVIDGQVFEHLQANIVKEHVRDSLRLVFVRFGSTSAGRRFLRELAPRVKSAAQHLDEVAAFRKSGEPGSTYVGIALTCAGYRALGVPIGRRPADRAFRRGMRFADLGDPPMERWEAAYQDVIHALVLVGDASSAAVDAVEAEIVTLIAASDAGVCLVGSETGTGMRNRAGQPIEHFGYVDGRSQPRFLPADIEREGHERGQRGWDPAFPVDRVIVTDPAAPDPAQHFGSYLVYRKLEQNVRLFKDQEHHLAEQLELTGDDVERAGALLVGRFEDGTPVVAQPVAADDPGAPVPNDFDYADDPDGMRCPLFAHVRKMNPRGSGGFASDEEERRHIMARRGQTYGRVDAHPGDDDAGDRPTGGVGLLFMALNVDIAEQFEFVQRRMADDPAFPPTPPGRPPAGPDLVLGRLHPGIAVTCPAVWGGEPGRDELPVVGLHHAVTMKGGEYFFLPSLAFLVSL